MVDHEYTNGVIAVKEKELLNERVLRLCEMNAAEAFRALAESGFGSGAEADAGNAEALAAKEEAALDLFIREYASSEAERAYLLSPRDFHNAKALFKAEYLHTDAAKMLAPEGLESVSDILSAVRGEGKTLSVSAAIEEAASLMDGERDVSGAEIGALFDRALYRYLLGVCKSRLLKRLLAQKADMTNLLIAFRSGSEEYARKLYLGGGTLPFETLSALFGTEETALKALEGTPYSAFGRLCLEAKREGRPFTQAERALSSSEAEYFYERRYELQGSQPFLYYVFRRRAEIANVRMIFVCINAGMKEQEIKRRLRAV